MRRRKREEERTRITAEAQRRLQCEDEMIRRINEACEGFPDQDEKDFLRLAEAGSGQLTEKEEW